MSNWVANAALAAVTGDIPIAEKLAAEGSKLRLKGAIWSVGCTAASSGGALGACHLQFGNSSGNLSTIIVGFGSSLTAPIRHSIQDSEGILSARCIRATFGTGSSVAGPLAVVIWGDFDE